MMTKEEARAKLPKVGDKLRKTPTYNKVNGDPDRAQTCEVIEVNREHLWYRVRFGNGFTECYKVPEVRLGHQGGLIG